MVIANVAIKDIADRTLITTTQEELIDSACIRTVTFHPADLSDLY